MSADQETVGETLSRLRSECETCGAWSTFTGRTETRDDGRTYAIVRCPKGDGEFPVWNLNREPLLAAYVRARDAATDPDALQRAFAVLTGAALAPVRELLASPPSELPLLSIEDVRVGPDQAYRWCELLLDFDGWRPRPTRQLRVEEALATGLHLENPALVASVRARATRAELDASVGSLRRRFPTFDASVLASPTSAQTLRRWAENMCRIQSTTRGELATAIDGHDETTLPAGVAWLELDEREIGLGGVRMTFSPGAITRAQFEQVFGRGEPLPRHIPDAPAKYMTSVEVPQAPIRCTVIADYKYDLEDVDVQGLYLRTDRARPTN